MGGNSIRMALWVVVMAGGGPILLPWWLAVVWAAELAGNARVSFWAVMDLFGLLGSLGD